MSTSRGIEKVPVTLASDFYKQDTLTVARQLLGCCLVHYDGKSTVAGTIVETEAYLRTDPAAHSYRGKTPGNSVLFGPSGHAHVFFIYGMHWCLNIVTGSKNRRGAVLLRALEPVEGIPLMEKRRGTHDLRNLCNGPGKLTQALGVTGKCNGAVFQSGPLRITAAKPAKFPLIPNEQVIQTRRIGISRAQEALYRFYIKENPFVSRK